jgi:hypothetical protein
MGEPGIGKTALLNAAGDADHGWWTLRSTGVEAERTAAFARVRPHRLGFKPPAVGASSRPPSLPK